MHDSDATAQTRRNANIARTALRLAVGGIFVAHAWQKFGDVSGTIASFARVTAPFPHVSAYLAIAGELFGGLGLLLGVMTPLMAWGPIVTTALGIYFLDGESGFYAARGGWEYALVLLCVCAYFATNGPGPHSIDAAIERARHRVRRRRRQWVAST